MPIVIIHCQAADPCVRELMLGIQAALPVTAAHANQPCITDVLAFCTANQLRRQELKPCRHGCTAVVCNCETCKQGTAVCGQHLVLG